jgi:hypothetical protein
MKKTLVFKYEIMSSVCEWPVEVSISKSKKSGIWTLYFDYVDPEAKAHGKHLFQTPEEFESVAEERNMDMDSFCQALIDSGNNELFELGTHIRNSPEMPMASELPKKFWKTRDAAIEHLMSNSRLPTGLVDLQDWLATDGWDDLLAAWINEDVALNLKEWATHKFSDSSLRDDEGHDDSVVINDQMRVDYAREAVSYAVENSEGDDSPSVHSFPIKRDDGRSAVLGCTVEIRGHGHIPQWHGVFADKDDFYMHLRAAGFLFHSEADEIGDSEILSLWVTEKKKKNKKTSK